jgi:hypothetical protein
VYSVSVEGFDAHSLGFCSQSSSEIQTPTQKTSLLYTRRMSKKQIKHNPSCPIRYIPSRRYLSSLFPPHLSQTKIPFLQSFPPFHINYPNSFIPKRFLYGVSPCKYVTNRRQQSFCVFVLLLHCHFSIHIPFSATSVLVLGARGWDVRCNYAACIYMYVCMYVCMWCRRVSWFTRTLYELMCSETSHDIAW